MQCGLLGETLSHSYSPQIHGYLGKYSYSPFEVLPNDLDLFFQKSEFDGINVTIPYKKAVIPYCHELSDRARLLGAVNTIVRKSDGTRIGHNTDYFGFSSMLIRSGLEVMDKKTLVLGSGGASATAVAVLKEAGAQVVVISRSGEDNYQNLYRHKDASVIVNTTPVGMFPHVDATPLDLSFFPNLEGVLDLIYNPARTQLLLQAEQLGLVAENGLWMLVAQAKESAEWFTGCKIDDTAIEQVHKNLRQQMENIILVGMPGSGKSTIGKLLALKLGRQFIDADAEIVNTAKKSIPEIFASSGESVFREIETSVLKQLGSKSNLVIATGGGCVTRNENYPTLHRNGTIIWLKRDTDKLPVDGRPLSQTNSLAQMYTIRQPLYEFFSDFSVDNNGSTQETTTKILKILGLEE